MRPMRSMHAPRRPRPVRLRIPHAPHNKVVRRNPPSRWISAYHLTVVHVSAVATRPHSRQWGASRPPSLRPHPSQPERRSPRPAARRSVAACGSDRNGLRWRWANMVASTRVQQAVDPGSVHLLFLEQGAGCAPQDREVGRRGEPCDVLEVELGVLVHHGPVGPLGDLPQPGEAGPDHVP
jgi:hypothetical protein